MNQDSMDIIKALQDLEAYQKRIFELELENSSIGLKAFEEAAKLADGWDAYKRECNSPHHDVRWCSDCDAKNNGAEEIAREIRTIAKRRRNDRRRKGREDVRVIQLHDA